MLYFSLNGNLGVGMEDIRHGLLLLEKIDKNKVDAQKLSNEDMCQILMFAFSECVSEYWPNLALKVLERNKNYMTDEVKVTLDEASKAKWSTQNFSHREQRILKS